MSGDVAKRIRRQGEFGIWSLEIETWNLLLGGGCKKRIGKTKARH